MTKIHPTAVVDPSAKLGDGCVVGPYCHVGADVELGNDCELLGNVTLLGPSRFGARNRFFPNCVLGAAPQDLKYKGGPTLLTVGSDNTFRELVTIHRGTEVDRASGGATRIGNKNLIMVGAHVAHDCDIGSNIIIANAVQLAGHVKIEDCVNIGGACAMHHFVTIGRNAFIAGMARIKHDAPPYMKIEGYDQAVRGVNHTGLARWGISHASIQNLKTAFRALYARRTSGPPKMLRARLTEVRENGLYHDEHVQYLVDFLESKLQRGVYGRAREADRTDSNRDIQKFYSQTAQGPVA
ncbi:MAG: acyl-ACP--UDP-N-acetylglucosamine O-acyltransferase [Phycisphaerae bacterium]